MLWNKNKSLSFPGSSTPALQSRSLPDIIKVTKPRKLRWKGHVKRMGETRNRDNVLGEKRERKR
jgi:hypothetical protein